MTIEQIQSIIDTGAYPGTKHPARLIETHISWVILTPQFAFKIKKPLALGFLDFSTLAKRRHFCFEELRLNKRLAPAMYLRVLPIAVQNGQPTIGAADAPPLDFALQMYRMDNRREMDKLLDANQVTAEHMEQLAAVLAPFHRKAVLFDIPDFQTEAYRTDFADLFRFDTDIIQRLGAPAGAVLEHWRRILPGFLERHQSRLKDRMHRGFWVDGHGDLHAKNIFLLDSGPLVFDCIEFSAHFRQADILNELAFLCMDLEARGHPEHAAVFLENYRRHWEIMPEPEDFELFRFFKAYRANIRLKVALLELRQHPSAELDELARRYWALLG